MIGHTKTGSELTQVECLCCGQHGSMTFWYRVHNYDIVRCCSCKHAQLLHMPSSSELAEFYSTYSALYPGRDTSDVRFLKTRNYHSWIAKKRLKKSVALLDQAADRVLNILEIGCGSGIFIEQIVNSGHFSTGIELSEQLAEQARLTNPSARIICGSLADADLLDGEFDLVVAWDVIEHVPEQRETFEKIKRVLKTGGVFAAATVNKASINRKLFGQHWSFFVPPEHVVFYDFQSLKLRLRKDWDLLQIRSYFAPQLTLHGLRKLANQNAKPGVSNHDIDHRLLYIKAYLSMAVDFFLSRTSLGDVIEFYVRKKHGVED